ncbi:MAG TPA: hypothetical protein PLD25_10955 [Chloroflexota bacterium]|nr:hypothetical protein [Chloroflexota bacterium]HUM70641.1 hypothetical protein [Chloroflexota bacterium]
MALLAETPAYIAATTAVPDNHTHTVYSQACRLALHEATHCAEIEALAEQLQKM